MSTTVRRRIPRPEWEWGPSRTKQGMKDECDINLIVARFARDGMVRHLAQGVPQYLDVSEVSDYRTAIETVRSAEDFFGKLPAKVRAHFDNDPAAFLDAMADPSRRDEFAGLREELYGDRRSPAWTRRESDTVTPSPEVGEGA